MLRLPMSMIENKDIHPYHLKQLKGLMRDIHAEFPMSQRHGAHIPPSSTQIRLKDSKNGS